MSIKTVSILGCGWLGLPLGVSLVRQSYLVKGATTTQEKIPRLQEAGINAFLLRCDPQLRGQGIEEFLKTDILIITLPFKRDFKDPYQYKAQMDSVIACAESSPIQYIIFTSSTSVYPRTIGHASEEKIFEPDNLRSKVLLEVENSLLENAHFKATVIRFGGLCGGSRQAGGFLAGKENLPNAKEPVNLIHLDDCVGIILEVIGKNVWGEVFNACADSHPTRAELYTTTAKRLGLSVPTFSGEGQGPYKMVSNQKIRERLDYHFKYPDPQAFPIN